MSRVVLYDFLMWCTIINYAIVLLWFLVFTGAKQWLYCLHTRWFKLSADQFDMVHYKGMAYYKIGIFLFNLAPFIALTIIS